jgi:DNA-binding CsgD family transcriptional regulator
MPDPLVQAAVPPLPLVGRERELARMSAALDRAAAGQGGVLLLAGEGGVGKTRLARALADAARERGMAVADGRAYAVETGVPYAIFADALRPMLRRHDAAGLTVLTRGTGRDLTHIFPTLFDAGSPASASGESPAEIKARIHWSFVQLLARLAARQPLLLLLDNLQWADAASIELLHFTARQAHEAGAGHVVIVGTYNDAEHERNAVLRNAEQSLVSLGIARVERLEPLSLASLVELVQRAFQNEEPAVERFAGLLHGWTRGNAFFVEETLKSLVEHGTLRRIDGRWTGWEVDELTLPRSVRDMVLGRLARVSAGARAVLDLAAVLGTRVPYSTLRVVSPAPPDALLAALDELRQLGLLVDAAEPETDCYDFSHPLVRDTAYDALGRARVQLLHGAIAEGLDAHYGARAMEHAGELAYHFTRAALGRPHPKTMPYLLEAGRQSLARHADRAAAGYLQAALDLRDSLGPDDAHPDVAVDAELVDSLARARLRIGEHDAALALFRRARDEAESHGDHARLAAVERRMGLMANANGRHELALAHYEAALRSAAAAGMEELTARLHLARANSLQSLGGRDDALREVHEALGIAERLGTAALLARVHRALLLLHAWTGPVSEARAHGERAIALAAQSGERHVEWSAHSAMAILGGLSGDAAATALHVRESERIADEIRSPVLRLWSADVAIEYKSIVGDWTTALALSDRAIPVARALGQRTLLPRLLVWTGLVHRGRGDLSRARQHVEEAWSLTGAADAQRPERPADVHALVPAHTGMAGYLMTVGENRRALEVGEAGLLIAERTGYLAWAIYRLLPFVIESSLYLEEYDRAARHNERLRRESEILGHALGLAWANTTDALLRYLTGSAAEAVPLLRAAADGLEAVPFVFDAARLRRLVARALRDAGDPEGAAKELRLAHDVFVRLGAERELGYAREELRALGAKPPVAPRSGGGEMLSAREMEIATLVARRRSNKEIAAALGISPRTVSTHLSNIFGKFGVSSRGELTDVVRRLQPEERSTH